MQRDMKRKPSVTNIPVALQTFDQASKLKLPGIRGRNSSSVATTAVTTPKQSPRTRTTSITRTKADEYKQWMRDAEKECDPALNRLRSVDFMVLDNSVRETTVGAIRGHNCETKLEILHAIKDTNLEEVVIGSFGGSHNVDVQLPEMWRRLAGSQAMDNAWGFAEFWTATANPDPPGKKSVDTTATWVPTAGLHQIFDLGICNTVLEVDLCDPTIEYPSSKELCHLLGRVMQTTRKRLPTRSDGSRGRVLINLRDFANFEDSNAATCEDEEIRQQGEAGFIRALTLVSAMGRLPPDDRPLGIMIEEPTGFMLPVQIAKNVKLLRRAMDAVGWKDARLLVHTHMNFGLAQAGMLESICAGADGMWGAVCRTGAHLGHACSAVTLANLARYGNVLNRPKDVGTLDPLCAGRYNLPAVIQAAQRVHALVTLRPVAPTEEVYGSNAFDVAFHGWHGFMQSRMDEVAMKCGVMLSHRITEFSGIPDIVAAMCERFGPKERSGWSPDVVPAMKKRITSDLLSDFRFDYNTVTGLAQLYEAAGGRITPTMLKTIEDSHKCVRLDRHPLMVELRRRWEAVADRELAKHEDRVYRSRSSVEWSVFCTDVCRLEKNDESKAFLRSRFDLDKNGFISWCEFEYRLKWSLLQGACLIETYATPEALIDGVISGLKAMAAREFTQLLEALECEEEVSDLVNDQTWANNLANAHTQGLMKTMSANDFMGAGPLGDGGGGVFDPQEEFKEVVPSSTSSQYGRIRLLSTNNNFTNQT